MLLANVQFTCFELVTCLTTHAAFQLRQANLLARTIGIFANTNRHKPGYRRWVCEVKLDAPTSDSGQIISLLVNKLADIFIPYQQYHRLGVFLYDFIPADALQTDLLGIVDTSNHDLSNARMEAIDRINQRHGKSKVHYAAEDLAITWQPKHNLRSPRYVSNWTELPTAKIYVR